ncbi:MAG: hypothetical protein PHP54_02800 [Clostridia bacterium]|nr:hypothetical protein [Clostridia bacterium]
MNNFLKKSLSILLVIGVCFCLGTSVMAKEVPQVESRAVSGSGQATGSNETFYIYSPSNSWWAHATFEVSGSNEQVIVQMWGPDGRLITVSGGAGFITLNPNSTKDLNFSDAKAGTYTITFTVYNGSSATVKCTLHDWYA